MTSQADFFGTVCMENRKNGYEKVALQREVPSLPLFLPNSPGSERPTKI